MNFGVEAATAKGKIEPDHRLSSLGVCVGELAYEVSDVSSLSPGFPDVGADRPRSTTHLVGQRVLFFSWKALRDFEDAHRLLERLLIHRKLSKALDHSRDRRWLLVFAFYRGGCQLLAACC